MKTGKKLLTLLAVLGCAASVFLSYKTSVWKQEDAKKHPYTIYEDLIYHPEFPEGNRIDPNRILSELKKTGEIEYHYTVSPAGVKSAVSETVSSYYYDSEGVHTFNYIVKKGSAEEADRTYLMVYHRNYDGILMERNTYELSEGNEVIDAVRVNYPDLENTKDYTTQEYDFEKNRMILRGYLNGKLSSVEVLDFENRPLQYRTRYVYEDGVLVAEEVEDPMAQGSKATYLYEYTYDDEETKQFLYEFTITHPVNGILSKDTTYYEYYKTGEQYRTIRIVENEEGQDVTITVNLYGHREAERRVLDAMDLPTGIVTLVHDSPIYRAPLDEASITEEVRSKGERIFIYGTERFGAIRSFLITQGEEEARYLTLKKGEYEITELSK